MLAASGQADSDDECVYLWPDCVDAWHHWCQVQTQWRAGVAGATGLDYAGVRTYFDIETDLTGDERREVFACIRGAERGTLAGWADRPKP